MIILRSGCSRFLSDKRPLPGQVLVSANAYVASVLQTGKIIGNGPGETEIRILEGGRPMACFRCAVTGEPGDHPLLMNRYNGIPGPAGQLEALAPELAGGKREILLEKQTAEAFGSMVREAKAQNIWLFANFGYRSLEQQQKVIDFYTEKEGPELAMQRCAPVGFSEHHSGLALDVGGGVWQDGVCVAEEPTAWRWIAEHCHEFGFMIKNPPGKEHITGTRPEPWHIRYLGDLEICSLLHREQLTLDEYLDRLPI